MSPLHSIWPVLMSCVLGFVSLFFGGQSVVNCCIVCLCVCFLASLNAVLLAGSAHWLPVCLLDCLIACSFRYMRLACFACRLIGWLAGEALPCAVMTLILVAKGAFFRGLSKVDALKPLKQVAVFQTSELLEHFA